MGKVEGGTGLNGIDPKKLKVKMPPDWHKARSPYALYEELCTALCTILGEKDANRIIAEVDPKANAYDLITAILRMHTVVDVAAAGCTATMLLDIVKNHMEDGALALIHAGHAGAFNLVYDPNHTLTELAKELEHERSACCHEADGIFKKMKGVT